MAARPAARPRRGRAWGTLRNMPEESTCRRRTRPDGSRSPSRWPASPTTRCRSVGDVDFPSCCGATTGSPSTPTCGARPSSSPSCRRPARPMPPCGAPWSGSGSRSPGSSSELTRPPRRSRPIAPARPRSAPRARARRGRADHRSGARERGPGARRRDRSDLVRARSGSSRTRSSWRSELRSMATAAAERFPAAGRTPEVAPGAGHERAGEDRSQPRRMPGRGPQALDEDGMFGRDDPDATQVCHRRPRTSADDRPIPRQRRRSRRAECG